jgi:hypothetical protein
MDPFHVSRFYLPSPGEGDEDDDMTGESDTDTTFIGEDAEEKAARADRVEDEISALRDFVANHTHTSQDVFVPGSGGGSLTQMPTSAPTSSPPQVGDTGADKLKIV